jgi:hypothetical protein
MVQVELAWGYSSHRDGVRGHADLGVFGFLVPAVVKR